jgi:hypothetical protein
MRAIIDATGLPQAVSYYRMFPREPARSAEDDMTIDHIVPVHHITLEAVLDQMLVAKAEREVLLVAHGEPRGLIMHLTAKRSVSALKEALDLISRVAAALARRAAIHEQPATDQVASWAALVEELKPGSVRGAFTVHEAEAWFGRWLGEQAGLVTTGGVHDLERLVRKMNEVRAAHFERVEVRACKLAEEALESLCNFFGAERVCAPSVGTFYVWVHPLVARPATLNRWERAYGGAARSPVYRRGAGPTARHYDVYIPGRRNPLDGLIVPEAFEIRVWETSRHPHLYASRAAAGSWSNVKAWVDENIMPLSRYQRGSFVLAGMWIFGRGSQPFAAPLDPEYREVLACSGRSAAGDFPASLTPGQALA